MCASTNVPSLNARDGMPDIVFYFTAMLIGVRDYDFISCCWSERNQVSLATGIDVELIYSYVNDTADVLSQNLQMCLKFISSTTYSSTSHPRTNPASTR